MNTDIMIPSGARTLIERLRAGGFRADIVGGCVRDALLGKTPNDYDITTSALPDEMKRVFSGLHVIETGIKHGTLTVMLEHQPYEVTTYRLDGSYSDGRHPDSVTFTRSLGEDLSRRDFTVNAMAYNDEDGLTDLFGGVSDLEAGLIRAVGAPEVRFSEDALRILRALRFASVMGFDIEECTAAALHKKCDTLSGISYERIFVEWTKLIGGRGAYGILSEYRDVISAAIPELTDIRLPDERLFADAASEVREMSLFAVADDPSAVYDAAMRRLRTDNKHRIRGKSVLSALGMPCSEDKDMRRLIMKLGKECAALYIKLTILLGRADCEAETRFSTVAESGIPCTVSELSVNGNDLAALGLRGRRIGEVLERLLSLVVDGELSPDREALCAAAAALSKE